jgi:hypothetical protein
MPRAKAPTKSIENHQNIAVGQSGTVQKPSRPLVFISHDHRDATLAEAFSDLLTDASGGFLKSFRSSDRKGNTGIEFRAEWYTEIMGKINDATDVVALLTSNSIHRPWILYEAGVAKGKLDKPVFGVVVGIQFDQATQGPFAQFQNSGDDEDSLTKLILQLIKRNSDAEPREEAVRRQVNAFREVVSKLNVAKVSSGQDQAAEVEANSVAKLFEEIKVMFRDLPDRLQGQLHDSLGSRARKRRRMHPMMLMDLLHHQPMEEEGSLAVGWLMVISTFKDETPWLFELGLDVYRAFQRDDYRAAEKAIERLEKTLESVRRGPMAKLMMDSPESEIAIHELGHLARRLLREPRRGP